MLITAVVNLRKASVKYLQLELPGLPNSRLHLISEHDTISAAANLIALFCENHPNAGDHNTLDIHGYIRAGRL